MVTAAATGMGRRLSGGRFSLVPLMDHLRQSVADILTTPKGTRVMRPEYGSDLPRLVDRPMDASARLLVTAATAEAIARWEPRVALERVEVSGGAGVLSVTAYFVLASGERGEPTVQIGGNAP